MRNILHLGLNQNNLYENRLRRLLSNKRLLSMLLALSVSGCAASPNNNSQITLSPQPTATSDVPTYTITPNATAQAYFDRGTATAQSERQSWDLQNATRAAEFRIAETTTAENKRCVIITRVIISPNAQQSYNIVNIVDADAHYGSVVIINEGNSDVTIRTPEEITETESNLVESALSDSTHVAGSNISLSANIPNTPGIETLRVVISEDAVKGDTATFTLYGPSGSVALDANGEPILNEIIPCDLLSDPTRMDILLSYEP